jgi:rubrerythrin
MSNYEKLAQAEKLEILAAKMYEAAAQRYANDDEARSLFLRLAEEEEEHARRIRMLASIYAGDRKLATDVSFPIGDFEALAADAEAVTRRLNSNQPLELHEFLVLVDALETRMANAHADLLARSGDPKLRRLFEFLSHQDKGHATLLGRRGGG